MGLGECDTDTTDPTDVEISVRLENLDTPLIGQPVHIFAPGETFPAGRLDVGEFRVVTLTVAEDESISFQAGRSGNILTTKSCTYTGNPGANRKVTWGGSSLSCSSGW